ncbi:MAG TPA: PHP-associated domain-containing protein [Dehalococcoidia bacterium]|nr:PHP-associated domain-containing protein [Dehalococcoidia bacterium]
MRASIEPEAGRGHALGKADLQVHTAHGDGMAGGEPMLAYIETKTDLDIVVITDHDDIGGAWKTRELWERGTYSFEVIVGIEVTTRAGHLLAIDVDRPIPSFRRPEETIRLIHEAGGLAVIPHPMSWLTRSIGQRTISRITSDPDPAVAFDGIEVMNQTIAARVTRAKAQRLNRDRWRLAETGGSDAHFLQAIGTAYTTFPGHTMAELRVALRDHTTGFGWSAFPSLRRLGVRQIARQQARGLMVTPRNVVFRPIGRTILRRRASA